MRLFEAKLHTAVISGVVLGGESSSLLEFGSPGALQAAFGEHKFLDVPRQLPP